MADVNVLYRHPAYYDIIFRRDVGPEVDFLLELFTARHGRPPGAVLDIGCGPGYHARAFARRGYPACGFEWYEEMIRFARAEAGREGVEVRWMKGDMRDFALDRPVDLAFCLFDSIDGLRTLDDFVAHFGAVARNLAPGGLYVIGQGHQRDTGIVGYGPFHYEGERDGCRVVIDWASDVRMDPRTQTAEVEIVVRIEERGQISQHRHRTIESFSTPPFLAAAARLAGGLEPCAWHGAYRLDQPLDDTPASTHCITVFERT
jgi:SAM-dependent methyltransferase